VCQFSNQRATTAVGVPVFLENPRLSAKNHAKHFISATWNDPENFADGLVFTIEIVRMASDIRAFRLAFAAERANAKRGHRS
jgi:hypothetical protein